MNIKRILFFERMLLLILVVTRSEITAECYINFALGIRSFQKPASSFLRSFDISFFAQNMQQYGTTGSTWFLDPLISPVHKSIVLNEVRI